VLLHLALAWALDGAGARAARSELPPRPAVTVVGVLELADAPPPVAAPPAAAAARSRAAAVAVAMPASRAASAPEAVSERAVRPDDRAEAPPPPPPPPQPADAPAVSVPPTAAAAAQPAPGAPIETAGLPASAPAAPPFEWPPSTRVSYVLTGQVRGEVHGHAKVDWVRDGDRYAVHLEVRVGLAVAPLMRRVMSSQGRLTPAGLAPTRYDELTDIVTRPTRTAALAFEAGRIRLADGREATAPAAVQDTASQFIQMAFRFATEPGLGEPGARLDLALALPRRVDVWGYDVIGTERLYTAFGAIDAVQVRPRPPAGAGSDVLTAEAWFAPRLRWLPVRIRIHQGPGIYIDLLIERLPDLLAGASEAVVPLPPPPPGPRPADGEADPFTPAAPR
jgi:hypothetical protein